MAIFQNTAASFDVAGEYICGRGVDKVRGTALLWLVW